jgi:methylenetetrahydrofolate reductase (NADPH)
MGKIIDYLNQSNKTMLSLEILPPRIGQGIQDIFTSLDPLMEFKPKFIDVTYHREEYVYKKRENGLLEKINIRKRPGTVGICASLMHKYDVDTVPHIICGGFTKEETESALIDLSYLGIENVLALRGDPIKSEASFVPTVGGHHYASELISQIKSMNEGAYLNSEIENARSTNFCIGVAGYPEKHFESPNQIIDLKYLKQKVDLGANYIVTQMFFDNEKYFQFVEKCRDLNINCPIIPGLKPITNKKQLSVLASIFHIDLPQDLVEAIYDCPNDEEVEKVGVEWLALQCKGLMKKNAPCLHFYSMGKNKAIKSVLEKIF